MTTAQAAAPAHRPRGPIAQFGRHFGATVLHLGRAHIFVAFTLVVMLIAGIYYGLIATPLYVSTSSFSIRGRDSSMGTVSATTLIGAVTGGSASGADSATLSEPAEIMDYINSPQMMEILDRRFHLRQMYSAPRLDLFNHISRSASQEDVLKFHQKMVIPALDKQSFVVHLEARSYSPKMAHDINDAVLNLTNDYVDSLSARIRGDTLREAERGVREAENEVRASRLNMTRYRANNGVVDPTQAASAQQGSVSGIQGQLDQAISDRAVLAAYSTPNAPLMQQADARIATLKHQLDAEQAKLASANQSNTLAQKLYGYEGLSATNDYAEKKLAAALQNYDAARVTAGQRERYLVRSVEPNVPTRPTLPKRLLGFFETVVMAVAGYGIIALFIAGIRDHQGL